MTKNFIIAVASMSALGACQANNATMSTNSSATTPQVLSLADVSASGQPNTLSTSMSILLRDNAANTVTPGARQATSAVTRTNANGEIEIDLTALGRTVTFLPEDLEDNGAQYKKTLPDGTDVYLWTYDGTWEEVRAGTSKFKYMVRFGTSDVSADKSINNRGYGVFGSQTPTELLPTSGTASYAGDVQFEGFLANDATARGKIQGDVNLMMDFASSQISGDMTNFRETSGSFEIVDITNPGVSLKINPATVSNGSFATDLSLEGARPGQELTKSALNGTFFGDEAQEVGGDLSMTATDGTDTGVAAGVFGASKQ